jgi:hypothetical protein
MPLGSQAYNENFIIETEIAGTFSTLMLPDIKVELTQALYLLESCKTIVEMYVLFFSKAFVHNIFYSEMKAKRHIDLHVKCPLLLPNVILTKI